MSTSNQGSLIPVHRGLSGAVKVTPSAGRQLPQIMFRFLQSGPTTFSELRLNHSNQGTS